MTRKAVYTVSSVNRYIKGLFDEDFALSNIYVKGEISNCKYHYSGHIYFTLKDSGSQIACVMFASDAKNLKARMKDGMEVTVYGSCRVFERDGKYQLYVKAVNMQGQGSLYEAYQALLKKFNNEGLFDPAHKKPLPFYPKKLGVVTASTGAAVRDIMSVSLRRNPYIQIVFCPAQVQGKGAAESVVRAIKALDAYGVDVMIVGRGGGSIEDLWAFNEEIVARAVYACQTPIVSAVGHETDTTIIDYVADQRAATPSAAAELAVPDFREIWQNFRVYAEMLDERMIGILNWKRRQLENYEKTLGHLTPERQILEKRQYLVSCADKLDYLMQHRIEQDKKECAYKSERLNQLMDRRLEDSRSRMALLANRLDGLSPLKQLERGYAYVSDDQGHGVTHIDQTREGDQLHIDVMDGQILATVSGISPKPEVR